MRKTRIRANAQRRLRRNWGTAVRRAFLFDIVTEKIVSLALPALLVFVVVAQTSEGASALDDATQIIANLFDRSADPAVPSMPPIHVIEVGNRNWADRSRPWEYRFALACIANAATKAGAKAVGLDYAFSDRFPMLTEQDTRLAEEAARFLDNPKIVVASRQLNRSRHLPIAESEPDDRLFSDRLQRWGIDTYTKLDDAPARTAQPLRIELGSDLRPTVVPSFSALLWNVGALGLSRPDILYGESGCAGSGKCRPLAPSELAIGANLPPDSLASGQSLRLRYPDADRVFSTTYLMSWFPEVTPKACDSIYQADPFTLRDRYVLIGESFPSSPDTVKNPLYFDLLGLIAFNGVRGAESAEWPGVYYHAYSLWNQIEGFPLARLNGSLGAAIAAGLIILALSYFIVLRWLPIFRTFTQMLSDPSYLRINAWFAVLALLVILGVLGLDGYLIHKTGHSFLGSSVIFWFAVAACGIMAADRFLHFVIASSPNVSGRGHLISPADPVELTRLHQAIGQAHQAVTIEFRFRVDRNWQVADIEDRIDRGIELIRGAARATSAEPATRLWHDSLALGPFLSNLAGNTIWLIGVLDASDRAEIQSALSRTRAWLLGVTQTEEFKELFGDARLHYGQVSLVNIHDELEDGAITFFGDAFEPVEAGGQDAASPTT